MKEPGSFKFELITPATAAKYLSKMPRNRALRAAKVRLMSTVFSTPGFQPNHQAIAFDGNGDLVDGQHRLQAIILSGMSVYLWVYRASEELPTLYIDGGIPKTDADALFIGGDDRATQQSIAILRRVLDGVNHVNVGTRLTRDQLKAAMDCHAAALEWALRLFPKRCKGISHAAVIGVLARAYYTQDKERLKEFVEILYSGIPGDGEQDRAALRLRDWLMTTPTTAGGNEARTIVARKTESALVAFLSRRPLSKIYEVSEEQFPIPSFDGDTADDTASHTGNEAVSRAGSDNHPKGQRSADSVRVGDRRQRHI